MPTLDRILGGLDRSRYPGAFGTGRFLQHGLRTGAKRQIVSLRLTSDLFRELRSPYLEPIAHFDTPVHHACYVRHVQGAVQGCTRGGCTRVVYTRHGLPVYTRHGLPAYTSLHQFIPVWPVPSSLAMFHMLWSMVLHGPDCHGPDCHGPD